MQGRYRGVPFSLRSRLAHVIAVVIVAVLSALIGHNHLNRNNDFGPFPPQVEGRARAIDGDSLFVGNSEVRLKGIDAPEGRQSCTKDGRAWACGNAARDELVRLVGGATVVCRVTGRDKHGRYLAACSADGRDLNAAMVASGMAVAFGGYEREQGEAKAARRGLWAGEFEQPRDWRYERGIGL